MIVRVKSVSPLDDYMLHVVFDNGKSVLYDVKDDIQNIPTYADLKNIRGLYNNVQLDESRT